jgi:GAF domain-containing protein
LIEPVKSPFFFASADKIGRYHQEAKDDGPGVTEYLLRQLSPARQEALELCARLDLSGIMYLGNTDACTSATKVAARIALGDDDVLTRQLAFFAALLPAPPQELAICDLFSHPIVKPMNISTGHRLRAVLGTSVLNQDKLNLGSLFFMDHEERRWTEEDRSELRFLSSLIGDFLPVPKTTSVKPSMPET